MSQLKELKEIREKLDNGTCTINDLKNIYTFVNTKAEVIVAKKDDTQHFYYRDNENRTVKLEEDLIPYESKIIEAWEPAMYPLDLCTIKFYDEITNRYGQGIILPRIKKFVMVDNMNLIKNPPTDSFYTRGINENNEKCGSIVDLKGNIYRMYGYGEEDEDFTLGRIEGLTPRTFHKKLYGTLVYYQDKTVYADICISPYIILNQESLREYVGNLPYTYIKQDIEKFDDDFMQGKRYVRK